MHRNVAEWSCTAFVTSSQRQHSSRDLILTAQLAAPRFGHIMHHLIAPGRMSSVEASHSPGTPARRRHTCQADGAGLDAAEQPHFVVALQLLVRCQPFAVRHDPRRELVQQRAAEPKLAGTLPKARQCSGVWPECSMLRPT